MQGIDTRELPWSSQRRRMGIACMLILVRSHTPPDAQGE